jgi:hypothetical protein
LCHHALLLLGWIHVALDAHHQLCTLHHCKGARGWRWGGWVGQLGSFCKSLQMILSSVVGT